MSTRPVRRLFGLGRKPRGAPSTPPVPRAKGREGPEEGGDGLLPHELFQQVRLIELRTRGWVDSLFGGEYHSIFKGQGMEFMEVREYQPGDDARHIDWNVTARMGRPFIKKHVEERELTVLLAVDLSASGAFATRGRFKVEVAAEIAAVLALSAVRNNDRVGLLIFTDQIEHLVPPRKGHRHALRLIRDLLAFHPRSAGTDLVGALEGIGRILRHRAIVFFLSDFLHPEPGPRQRELPDGSGMGRSVEVVLADFERALRPVARRHDLIAITISDTAELVLPDAGLIAIIDPETGEEWITDSSAAGVQELFSAHTAAQRAALTRVFGRYAVDEIEISTDGPYIEPLLGFFRKRGREARR